MKKIILSALAVALMAIPAVQAQKVNKAALLSKIEKSDADIADAKKGARAATWINRGNTFYDVAVAPTAGIFVGMESTLLQLAVGAPTATEKATLPAGEFDAWVYPYFTAYIKEGKVATWKQTQWVLKDAPEKAIEAYNKALELDMKSTEKVKAGLKQVSDFCAQAGNLGLDTGDSADAADAYALAYKAQSSPANGTPADASLLYNAGYLRTADGATNPASFPIASDFLNKALELGYTDKEGNIYYYLFHSYYGQRETDPSFIEKGKQALLTGVEKFPKNERIIDGLMQLYTLEEGVGNPADLVALIDAAIAENPENTDLWFGRGRIYNAMKNYDESIASFKKVAELKPELFEGNYWTGVFYVLKGEEMLQKLNDRPYSSQAAYDEDRKGVNDVYREAIPWLEKAYQINPNDVNTLEFLKSITYLLRDEQGMMDKYNKYDVLYKEAKGEM